MESQTEEQKQSPNQTAITETDKETKRNKTIDLLNPMSGYVQHTTHLHPNAAFTGKILNVLWKLMKLGKAND